MKCLSELSEVKIRHNHPNLRGSFTCLGVWFNVLNADSMKDCEAMLKRITSKRDKATAKKEIKQAQIAAENWQPESYMWWFYKQYARENNLELSEVRNEN
jgi:hypothetical protein